MKIDEIGDEGEEQEREEGEEQEKYLLDDGSPLYSVDMQILSLHFFKKIKRFRLKQIYGKD
jgi:hypothetical protein